MRYVLIAALAVGLTGCGGNSDFFGDSSSSNPPPPAPAPQMTAAAGSTEQPAASQTVPPDVHCTTLAKQRAIDSAYEGEDPDTQRAVFDRSYSDCMAWDAKHRS